MPNLPEYVIYPKTDSRDLVTVEPCPLHELTASDAREVLGFLSLTHTALFEDTATRDDALPPGTVEQHYNPTDNGAIASHLADMEHDIRNGSQYWRAYSGMRNSSPQAPLEGLIKVSPSTATVAQKLRLQTPNMFVNDILTRDPGTGIGSVLLHAATTYGGFRRNGPIALHAYTGTKAQGWFHDKGFREVAGVDVAPAKFGSFEIGQVLLSTEGVVTLHGVKEALERIPGLAESRSV